MCNFIPKKLKWIGNLFSKNSVKNYWEFISIYKKKTANFKFAQWHKENTLWQAERRADSIQKKNESSLRSRFLKEPQLLSRLNFNEKNH